MIKFESGRIYVTTGAFNAVDKATIEKCLARHLHGDWGDVPQEDKESNDEAVNNEDSIYSAYPLQNSSSKFWIITEWNRSCTTVLLPSEQ